jgi:probable rRNA maturation factor
VSGPEPDFSLESPAWDLHPGAEAIVRRAIAAAAASCGRRLSAGAEVGVVLTDDEGIAAINGRWRDKPTPTNVLSFPMSPVDGLARAPMLGDIVLTCETIAREAQAEGKSFEDHLAHLSVHGFLHLVGHDHESEEEAQAMEGLETRILAGLGIADPYGASGPDGATAAR